MSEEMVMTVSSEDAGIRLDAYLAQCGCYPSRSAAAKSIESGEVLVDGVIRQKRYSVQAGDLISFALQPKQPLQLAGTPIELDIRYEDDDLLVLSKQVGLVCHPAADHVDDTLVNALIYHCGMDKLCNVQGEEDERLGIVHRLDRDTSGLMLAAKSDFAGVALMDQIRNRRVDRHYIALVHGLISVDSGMIDAPITRHPAERMKMAVRDDASARDAITTFTVMARFKPGPRDNGYTLLDCKLFTGRTHQIRVHMEYIKHPIVGDPLYVSHSPKQSDSQLGLSRQFLHSYRLIFEHPRTGETVRFADHCPEDLRNALARLSDFQIGVTPFGEEVRELLRDAPYPKLG